MMSKTNKIEKMKHHLKYLLDEMEKKEREINPKYRLAEYLHTTFCHHNHTDGCGWYYEINNGVHDWERYEHKAYLEDAEKLLSITTEEVIEKLGRLEKAIIFATKAFNRQLDKVGVPSIFHSLTVMRLQEGIQSDLSESYMVVAVLHDIMEDTHFKMEDILKEVDLSIYEQNALELLTHRNNESYTEYIQRIKDSGNKLAINIKLADVIHNSSRSRDGLSVETIERLEKKRSIAMKILLGKE